MNKIIYLKGYAYHISNNNVKKETSDTEENQAISVE